MVDSLIPVCFKQCNVMCPAQMMENVLPIYTRYHHSCWCCWLTIRTHCRRNKMAAILQTFWTSFSWMKIAVISFKFHWSPIDIQGTTGSDNGLLPNGQQGITSICDGLIYWCILYRSMRGLGELMQYSLALLHCDLDIIAVIFFEVRVLTKYTPEFTR